MSPFIYGSRNGIHIMDLTQTVPMLDQALIAIRDTVAKGGRVLFVGTKRQAQKPVADAAEKSAQYFMNHRWLGGTLTNFRTIRDRLGRLEELESIRNSEAINSYSKKMQSTLNREYRKIYRNLNGMRTMTRLPECLVVVDPKKEKDAVKEARALGIPVVSLIDTDCDPDTIDLPIPGNDDSMRSIEVITRLLADAVAAGKAQAALQQQASNEGAAKEAAKKAEAKAAAEKAAAAAAAETAAVEA